MNRFFGTADLARSWQGDVRLVGELRLDNRKELIALLDGATPRSSDAELALAAYLRWGASCPRRLLGDFAFAVQDGRRRRLLLACDPLGVKPLHYAERGSLFVFAADAQQVLQHPSVPCRLDEITVGDYLDGRLCETGRTFFRDVRRLPPGHTLVATPEAVRIERFWDLPDDRIVYRRDEEYEAHFLDLFQRAVEDRLQPRTGAVGVLMSGGLDSCSVAAVAHRALSGGDAPRLFAGSFVFDRLPECDERRHIQATADHLGIETELVPAERFLPFADPDTFGPSLESPFTAWDGGFREMLRRARNRGARVLLTGHGADDLLAGSVLVYADRLRRGDLRAVLEVARHAAGRGRAWRWVLYNYLARPLLPPALDEALGRLTGRAPEPGLPDWIDPGFARRTGLIERRRTASASPGGTARQAIRERFLQAPWETSVHWYDRIASSQGIEVRHPFLDRRLVELLAAIPPAQLFRAGSYKPLLRRAVKGLLPEPVRLRRDKTRLEAFVDLSLREQSAAVERLLAAPAASDLGILASAQLRAAYRNYLESAPGETPRLWYALALEAWLRRHRLLGLDFSAAEHRPAA